MFSNEFRNLTRIEIEQLMLRITVVIRVTSMSNWRNLGNSLRFALDGGAIA